MRRLIGVLCLLGAISGASAEELDLPTLRGSDPFVPAAPVFTNWGGLYVGAQYGVGSTNMDFSGATKSLIQLMLQQLALENEGKVSQWSVLGKTDNQATTYGGFIGYNSQWDDVVLGIDANFSHSHFFADAPVAPLGRVLSAGGNVYDVTVDGSASMRLTDFATIRGRAGYVMNNFMPYATFGVALGLADVKRSATVSGMENPSAPPDITTCGTAAAPNCVPFSYTRSEAKDSAFLVGWSAGAGIDVLVLPNVFVRGEYEYISFGTNYGTRATINSARVGAGYKF